MATITSTNRRQSKARISLGSQVSFWLSILMLVALGVIVFAPILWAFSSSLRNPTEAFKLPPEWLPVSPNFSNYEKVFQYIPFFTYLLNSIFVCTAIILGQLVTATLAGYAFARLPFPGRGAFFWIILSTMMIPVQATIIPIFVVMSRLRLIDTHAALILPAVVTAFGTFLLRQYFLRIPNEFEEAAVLDGANQFQVFYRIYLPLSLPGMAILVMLSFNFYWNDFYRPLIFVSSNEKYTLPLGIVSLFGSLGTNSLSVVLAGVMLALLPVFIIYTLGQRYLIEGIAMGGLKG
jgi:multiple sugar transport system permease protein